MSPNWEEEPERVIAPGGYLSWSFRAAPHPRSRIRLWHLSIVFSLHDNSESRFSSKPISIVAAYNHVEILLRMIIHNERDVDGLA